VKKNFSTRKRDLESHHESNASPSCLDEGNLSPKKTNLIAKKHHNSTLTDTERSVTTNTTRPPLMPLDLNSNDNISRQQSVSLGRDARSSKPLDLNSNDDPSEQNRTWLSRKDKKKDKKNSRNLQAKEKKAGKLPNQQPL